MNIKRTFAIVFFAVALPFFFYSCSKDDDEIVTTPTEEEEEEDDPVTPTESVYSWIESEMRENYYWYSEIPAASSLNYKLGVPDFFDSLLSSKDGKHNDSSDYFYSYIESTSDVSASTKSISQTDYSYGFEFQLYNMVDQNDNPLGYSYAHILYVVPNSPASEAGIKRGMWITKIDGKNITASNYTTLLGSTATKFTMATFETDKRFVAAGDISISSARAIEDDPVHYDTIITDQKSGKKIGYLVYNHFTDSKTDGDEKYNKELLALSKEFAGVDEFVLDLRYNGGGLITCAQLLSTILAPSSALNQTFCNMTFNDKQSPR
ncbi:MAG: S41 family peptidase, partial [Bacteroides graminisolvens]|nr:S41 family peptidase [Bacteroides graminisolvens]